MAARKPQPQPQPDTPAEQQPPAHSVDAIQDVWDAARARRGDAVQLAEQIDAIDAYIDQARRGLAKAEADHAAVSERHAAVLAKANELRNMVTEYCDRHGLPLPKDPEPGQPSALDAALSDLDDRARKHPAPVHTQVRPLTAAEIAGGLDPDYGYLLGLAVKVWIKGTLETLAGVLVRVDAEWITLEDNSGRPRSHPRSMVERIEPAHPYLYPPDDPRHRHDTDAAGGCRHPACGHNSGVGQSGDDHDDLNDYGRLPERPADTRPEIGEQPAEARALAAGVRPWLLLAVGLRLAAPAARRRAAWARSGHWRHRAGALRNAIRPGAVRGVTV
jgi:hypothetical protein